jgi:4a-hydroxytetrahydrobiopterin dehydratase
VGRRDLLDDAAVAAGLDGLRWMRDGSSLVARVDLPSFRDAIAFVEAVAGIAESMDHHPDIDIRWRTVILRVTTHDRGGITSMDLEFARRVDALDAEPRP